MHWVVNPALKYYIWQEYVCRFLKQMFVLSQRCQSAVNSKFHLFAKIIVCSIQLAQ